MPPKFVISPANQTVASGDTAVFSCQVTGDPQPTVIWYKSRNPLSDNARYSILSNGTLLVKSVRQQEAGWFTCEASNNAGRAERKAFLIVTGVCLL